MSNDPKRKSKYAPSAKPRSKRRQYRPQRFCFSEKHFSARKRNAGRVQERLAILEELNKLSTDEETRQFLKLKNLRDEQIANFEETARKHSDRAPTPKERKVESAGSGQGKRTLTNEMQTHLLSVVVLCRGEKPLFKVTREGRGVSTEPTDTKAS